MKIFAEFMLFIFLILIILTPILSPILFNFLSFILILYLIPSEIYFVELSSVIALSFALCMFNIFINIFLSILGFSKKTISNMLRENKLVGFSLKATSYLTSMLLGYSILKSIKFTSLILYRHGLIFFAIFSSLLNLLFTYLYIIIMDKHKE